MAPYVSKFLTRFLDGTRGNFGSPPSSFTFGEGIDWDSELVETDLFIELPFWLMTPAGKVTVKWLGNEFNIEICTPWIEVFHFMVTDSEKTIIYFGPVRSFNADPDRQFFWSPSTEVAEEMAAKGDTYLQRICKTVLKITVSAHSDAFRVLTDVDPPRVGGEHEAYWASICEVHLPVINELIQRYRLITYDYFPYEVTAWDVPIWHLRQGQQRRRAVLLPYKGWDSKPVIVEDGDDPNGPPKLTEFEWTNPNDLTSARSDDASPGEFDLLDARSLMERGDYNGAVRRTVTALEVLVDSLLLDELNRRSSAPSVTKQLKSMENNFPRRFKEWCHLCGRVIPQAQIDDFMQTRKVRHKIVHRGVRLTHADRDQAQRMVDTGRWLYNKVEDKPDRASAREGKVLKSVGRVGLSVRFPATLGSEGFTLGPLR